MVEEEEEVILLPPPPPLHPPVKRDFFRLMLPYKGGEKREKIYSAGKSLVRP